MLAAASILFALAPAVYAAAPPPVHVDPLDLTLAPGASGSVGVRLEIQPGYHVYADMLEVSVVSDGGLKLGAVRYPTGTEAADPAAPGQFRELYDGALVVDLPVVAPARSASRAASNARAHAVQLHVRYQACTKDLCTMPIEEDVTAVVNVSAPEGRVYPSPTLPYSWLVSSAFAEPAAAGGAADAIAEKAVIFSAGPAKDDHLVIHADLQGEWHLNKMFVGATLPNKTVSVPGNPTPVELTLGDLILPAAHPSGKVEDGSFREDFTEDFDIIVPIAGATMDTNVEVEVAYQACKGLLLCAMPTSEKLTVPVHMTGAPLPPPAAPVEAAPVEAAPVEAAAPAVAAAPVVSAPPSSGSAFDAARERGFTALVILCFLAGIGVSFTPCVLPMVPITLGMIGARGATTRLGSLAFTSAYVLGLASVYTGLGVFAGVTGELFGSWLQSPIIVSCIAVFFIAMGGSMFGFFDVQLPAALAGRIQSGERRGGYFGAFAVGMIGAVVAGPCSGPVVVSILALIGTGGVKLGAALMFAFSLGMGMIFVLTGMASGLLPSRGPWMVVVKKSFGIVMWLGAIYYAAPQLPVLATALATSAVCIVTGIFSWPSEEDGEGWFIQRLRQTWTVVGVLVGGWLLIAAMMTEGFILPPVQIGSAAVSTGAKITWMSDEEQAIAAAMASGKPVMIDFTAEWCASCHEMEKLTYTNSAVIAESQNFVTVMIDCTERADPKVKAIQTKYGVKGLPTVVFTNSAGVKVRETFGFVPAGEFVQVMSAARAEAG